MITHVATVAHNETNPTTSCTVTIPITAKVGDDLYLQVTSRGSTSGDPLVVPVDPGIGSWKLEREADGTHKATLWWRRVDSDLIPGTTFAITGAITSMAVLLSVYRGGWNGGDPTGDITAEANVSPDKAMAAFTPSLPGEMCCCTIFDSSNNTSVTGMTSTDPAVWTLQGEVLNANASGCATTHFSAPQAAGLPVTTGTINWAMVNQSTKSIAWTIRAEDFMTWVSGDRVHETTTTTGTGDLTLGGAATAKEQAFSAVASNLDLVAYAIVHQSANEWEVGVGRWVTGGVLQRVKILQSSAGGSTLVSFSAGTKDVFNTFPAGHGLLPACNREQTTEVFVPDSASVTVSGKYRIAAGKKLTLGLDATLRIN